MSFGTDWEKGTVTDIFRDHISRFRSLLTSNEHDDSLEKLEFYPNVFRWLGEIVRKMDFELVRSSYIDHTTPFGTMQNFLFCTFRKKIAA